MSRAFANDTSPLQDCCEGTGRRKIESITLRFIGGGCTMANSQDPNRVACEGDAGASPVWIIATNKEEYFQGSGDPNPSARVWFNSGPVNLNGEFTADAGPGNELSGETWIHIYSGDPAPDNEIQRISFHTSCSQPLRAGDRFGSVVLVSCVPAGTTEASAETTDAGNCCQDGEGIGSLTLQYKGWDREVMVVASDTDKYLTGKGELKPSAKLWFQGSVPAGGSFTLGALPGETLGKSTWLHVSDPDTGEVLETVLIPTSCDQPIRVGDLFGPFELQACSGPAA
jgi:hypothetical protein